MIPTWGKSSDAGGNHRAITSDDLDRQCMHARLELCVERFHDGAMLLQAGLSGEVRRRDSDAEMGLTARPRSRMTSMSVALVEHFKMGWSEFSGKFFNNRIANGHMDTGSGQVGDKA